MDFNEDAIWAHRNEFEVLSVSTNIVRRFRAGNKHYIMKTNTQRPAALSPFWWAMHDLFGLDLGAQARFAPELIRTLKNPHIPMPEPVLISQKHGFIVYRQSEGVAYEPDIFPDSDGAAYQLGRFIGHNHANRADGFGWCGGARESRRFQSGVRSTMRGLIDRHWQGDADVHAMFGRVDIVEPGSFCLIMPDISANQFLFTCDMSGITALVDLDAYVYGPAEMELTIIEMCLTSPTAFKNGYETYLPLPDISAQRDFYRFFSYLCDPEAKTALDAFMGQNTLF